MNIGAGLKVGGVTSGLDKTSLIRYGVYKTVNSLRQNYLNQVALVNLSPHTEN